MQPSTEDIAAVKRLHPVVVKVLETIDEGLGTEATNEEEMLVFGFCLKKLLDKAPSAQRIDMLADIVGKVLQAIARDRARSARETLESLREAMNDAST